MGRRRAAARHRPPASPAAPLTRDLARRVVPDLAGAALRDQRRCPARPRGHRRGATPVGLAAGRGFDQRWRAMWARSGTGRGIDVALIDTGIAPVAGLTGPGKVVNSQVVLLWSQSGDRRYVDNNGHGTHMAGIIAGNDYQGGTGLTWRTSALIAATRYLGDRGGPERPTGQCQGGRRVTVSRTFRRCWRASTGWSSTPTIPMAGNGTGLNIRVPNISYGTDSTQSAAINLPAGTRRARSLGAAGSSWWPRPATTATPRAGSPTQRLTRTSLLWARLTPACPGVLSDDTGAELLQPGRWRTRS